MPRGILIGQTRLNVVASGHYINVLGGVSPKLRTAAASFVDGDAAKVSDGGVEIWMYEGDETEATFALRDYDSSILMLIASVKARNLVDLQSTGDSAIVAAIPDSFQTQSGTCLEIFNCVLALTPWTCSRFDAGHWP